MSETPKPMKAHPEPDIYEICVKGHLDTRWASQFEGLTITWEKDGDTLLTGAVIDQAALYGLLKKIRDLGMLLISVNCFKADHPDASDVRHSINIFHKKEKKT